MGLEERCGYQRRGKIDGERSGNDRLKRAAEEKAGVVVVVVGEGGLDKERRWRVKGEDEETK